MLRTLALPIAPLLLALPALAQVSERVSVEAGGGETNDDSFDPDVSPGGRWVVFESDATDLVPGDLNGRRDVFRKDRQSGAVALVSVTFAGTQGNGDSVNPCVSADGRWVAFESTATSFLTVDANGTDADIFLKDMSTGSLFLASIDSSGFQADKRSVEPSISDDGQRVAFSSLANNLFPGDTNSLSDVYVYFHLLGTSLVSVTTTGGPAGFCFQPSISPDGECVAYRSIAGTIVAGDTNGAYDIFVRDLSASTTTLASQSSAGVLSDGASFSPSMGEGFVAFLSQGTNLVPGDTNGQSDIFVHDVQFGLTSRVSVSSGGAQGNASSDDPAISADGRWVAYRSSASNLVPGDTNGQIDVFVRDRAAGVTLLASRPAGGGQASGLSFEPAVDDVDGSVLFASSASNLVPGDTNASWDVFLARPIWPPVTYCVAKVNSQGCSPGMSWSGLPSASSGLAFDVLGTGVLNNKNGIFFYSLDGRNDASFQGGTLCAKQPVKRTQLQNSGGNPPPDDCSGVFTLDFNARIQSGVDPALQAGVRVTGQYWYRDPTAPFTTGLTNAIDFVIGS